MRGHIFGQNSADGVRQAGDLLGAMKEFCKVAALAGEYVRKFAWFH